MKSKKKPGVGKAARGQKRKVAGVKAVAQKKKTTGSEKADAKKKGGAWAAVFAPRKAGEKRYWLVKSERLSVVVPVSLISNLPPPQVAPLSIPVISGVTG